VIDVLSRAYPVSVLFYNPNIQPEEEYARRLQSMQKLCDLTQTELFVLQDDIHLWGSRVQGLETDPEGGRRCSLCFEMRLGKAAEFANQQGFDAFTTTLTVSPHKSSQRIQAIGNRIALSTGIRFLAEDFKLEDGYRRSCLLSREYGLYRQKYCGCRFSLRQQDNETSKRA
jgi:hypothetical protein